MEIKALKTERYTHPYPKVQRKMEALYRKSLKVEHQHNVQLVVDNRIRYERELPKGEIRKHRDKRDKHIFVII